jgi:hypothetical protein
MPAPDASAGEAAMHLSLQVSRRPAFHADEIE